MINLDLYRNRTIDFMINGELVKVNEPSYSALQEFESAGENGIDGIIKAIVKVLNNNSSAVKFTETEVKKWNKGMINAIIQSIADEKAVVDNNPK